MNKTAVIYTRVSTEEQSDNYSLSTQLDACRAYAAQHGFDIVGEYTDSFTGTMLERPHFDQVKKLAGTITVLIVYTQDRLGRAEALDTWNLIADLEHKGTEVHCVDRGKIDISNFFGQLEMLFRAKAAKEESEKIGERTARGKKARARAGKVLVSQFVPFGYTYDSPSGMFVIHEDQARIVRLMYQWYVYGDESGKKLGGSAIATRLTKLAVPTKFDTDGLYKSKRSPGVWARSSVMKILRNETYTGVWYYNRKKTGKTPNSKTWKDRSEWIPVSVPIIISCDLWKAAQQQGKTNTTQCKRNTKSDYLLRGHLICGTCGYGFRCKSDYRTVSQKWHRYMCRGQESAFSHDGKGPICHRSLRQGDIDQIVWDKIASFIKNPAAMIKTMQKEHAELDAQAQPDKEYLARCSSLLEKFDDRRKRLLKLYLDGVYEKDWLDQEMALWGKEKQELEDKIRDLQFRLAKVEIEKTQIEQVQAFCQKRASGIDAYTFEDQRMVLDLLNIKAIVYRGTTEQEDVIRLSGYIPMVEISRSFAATASEWAGGGA